MYTVGLTGGIGSGKSTFAALLAERGAQVIDADQLGRDALKPGRRAWRDAVDSFGDEILVAGTLEIDRQRLADIVFSDPNKLAALNAITHPVIARAIADHMERLAATDAIVVVDAALIVELGLDKALDALIVVDTGAESRQARLVASRRMHPRDIQARMASQSRPEDLIERADIVVRNDGTIDDLVAEADRVWAELQKRAA
ncbi:MAG: dephospho-CoA kinase [Actinomycetota bacterium]